MKLNAHPGLDTCFPLSAAQASGPVDNPRWPGLLVLNLYRVGVNVDGYATAHFKSLLGFEGMHWVACAALEQTGAWCLATC